MLQSKLNTIYNEAVEKVIAANIPLDINKIQRVVINTRAKKRWGQCKKLPNGKFEININTDLVEQSEDGTLNTVIHELLHTIDGCLNHGEQWKRYANKINRIYGMNIKRTSNAEDKGVERTVTKVDYKYILQCQGCNQIFRRSRQTQFVTNPQIYKCGGCGGDIKRIK
jgi:predicted SprT family Zn-dependent metalloprotease